MRNKRPGHLREREWSRALFIERYNNQSANCLIDEQDQVVYQKRLANDLSLIGEQLSPYASSLGGDCAGVD